MKNMYWVLIITGILIVAAALCYVYVRHNTSTYITDENGWIVDESKYMSSTLKSICAVHPGYVVDEYQNKEGVTGGFIVYSTTATGASSYHYSADGKQLSQVDSLPVYLNSAEGQKAAQWAKDLIMNFPQKKTTSCDN